MTIRFIGIAAFGALLTLATGPAAAADTSERSDELSEITVEARRVANDKPAGTYATPATALRFDPLTELQSRGIAEGQADVTVRGGLFENTGFRLGAATVFDPQTGHYVAELPIDPAWLTSPVIKHGIDNSLMGFNSNIATVAYGFAPLSPGGEFILGFGSDSLEYQSLRFGTALPSGGGVRNMAAVSFARSSGDGTLANGDHEFSRVNLALQRQGARSQSELILAYQDKFYGWPGAYTGFANLAETDDTQTALLFLNHRQDSERGWWRVSGYYRSLEDDYDFDRSTQESGAPGSFEHETRVFAAAADGVFEAGRVAWHFAAQASKDELVRSTDLTEGFFNDRSYLTVSVVPEISLLNEADRSLTLRVGANADLSNRDSNALLPQLGVRYTRSKDRAEHTLSLEYAANSQVPGYTALNSRPAGLFGGNPALGRERADQLVLTLMRETADSRLSLAVFHREDSDLVDWTFAAGAPFARQANPVDLDVDGIELMGSIARGALELSGGYTWLDKSSDYRGANVDASYYALNYARHRATLALIYTPVDSLELRLDNEYRVQEDNPLRAGDDETYWGSVALRWLPQRIDGLRVQLTVDNLSDSDYQQFPGTPAVGRQTTLSAGYSW
ncbi:MAG: TonB-dependent receptor [Pseudomonadota bacterium]